MDEEQDFDIIKHITKAKLDGAKHIIYDDAEHAQLYLFLYEKSKSVEQLTFREVVEGTTITLNTLEARLFLVQALGGFEIVRTNKRDRNIVLDKKGFDAGDIKTCEECIKREEFNMYQAVADEERQLSKQYDAQDIINAQKEEMNKGEEK